MTILRFCVASLTVVCSFCLFAVNGWAQNYPAKVVRYLLPDGAGSGGDVIGRIVASGLSELFGQQVIVENRPGAGGRIGAEIAAKAPADGYTLLHMSNTLTANVSLYKNLPYDLVNDFTPVTQLALAPAVAIVHPSLPVKSISDLVKLAKAKPDAINYASAGTGSGSFVSAVLFTSMVGVKMVHVPYKGGGEALTNVLSGESPLFFPPAATALPHIRSGRLRALAVTTATRLPLLAEVPTMSEAGVAGFAMSYWFGLLVPVKTPKEIVATLYRAAITTLNRPDIAKRINEAGCIPVGSKPEEFGAYLKKDIAMHAEAFKNAGVSAN